MSSGQLLSPVAVIGGSIAIAALVRIIEDVSWRIVAVVIGATLVFMFEPLFLGGIPVPLDEVARGYPYRGITGVSDSLNPDANATRRSRCSSGCRPGRAPLWNQWAFSGYPLLENAQSAPFYPLFIGTLWVPLPEGWGTAPGWTRIYEGIDGTVWRNLESLPRAYMPQAVELAMEGEVWGRIEAVEDFSRRVIVQADRPRLRMRSGSWRRASRRCLAGESRLRPGRFASNGSTARSSGSGFLEEPRRCGFGIGRGSGCGPWSVAEWGF